MSFDSEFDYTGSITFINNRTDTINVEVSSITTKLADLANVDAAFDYLTTPEMTSLNHTKNVYNTMVSNLQTLKGEINIVTALGSNDKANLYSFFTDSVAEPKQQWMTRMIYNTTGLASDAGNVIGGSLTSDQANLVAELVCQKYQIAGIAHQVQSQF